MDRFRLGPQATATGLAKKRAGFAVDARALAARRQRQQKNEEGGECEFALPNKGLRRGLDVFSGKSGRNELKKSSECRRKLA